MQTRMQTERGFADVNGTRLYYEIGGVNRQDSSPLVFVHGFTLDLRMWDEQFEALGQAHRVVRYDMRGFGKSAHVTDEPYSQQDDLAALLDFLQIERVTPIGLSKGGGVVLDFAIAYPQRVDKLVVLDSILGGFYWKPGGKGEMRPVFAEAREKGLAAAKAKWLAHPVFEPCNEQPAIAARLGAIVDDYSGWHFLNSDTDTGIQPRAIHRLHEIQAPLLVIVGERDLEEFREIADLLGREVANARLVVVAGAGHMCNMEAPQEVTRLIAEFLEP